MRTSTTNLVAAFTIGLAVCAANTASAGFGFGGGGGQGGGISFGGNKGGGVSISFGGNKHANHDNHHKFYHHKHYYHAPVKSYYVRPLLYDQCYHPRYCYCVVYPGDSWLSICQRIYGCTHVWKHIAIYNGLPMSARLVVGQQLALPVINANGTLAASNAPVAPALAPQAQPAIAPSQPAVTQPATSEPAMPTAAVGSTLMFSGESLGAKQGVVRLRVGEMALPVAISEWTETSVKIELPKMDLSRAMKAELEVLRADGTLASKSAFELTPAAASLALGN